MAAYLEARLKEAPGDATFITKALGDIARAKHDRGHKRANWAMGGRLCRSLTVLGIVS